MKSTLTLFFFLCGMTLLYAQKGKSSEGSLKQNMVGTWALVSVTNIYPDGNKVYPYSDNPQGMLMVDKAGHYAIQILKAKRPKVASGDKNVCTPEENAALVQGSNSHFGQYSMDEKNKTITFSIEHASFPNWEGTQQKRSYTFVNNTLTYVVTHTTQGGQPVISEVAWRKL
jgi:Lipocalin-like domain